MWFGIMLGMRGGRIENWQGDQPVWELRLTKERNREVEYGGYSFSGRFIGI